MMKRKPTEQEILARIEFLWNNWPTSGYTKDKNFNLYWTNTWAHASKRSNFYSIAVFKNDKYLVNMKLPYGELSKYVYKDSGFNHRALFTKEELKFLDLNGFTINSFMNDQNVEDWIYED